MKYKIMLYLLLFLMCFPTIASANDAILYGEDQEVQQEEPSTDTTKPTTEGSNPVSREDVKNMFGVGLFEVGNAEDTPTSLRVKEIVFKGVVLLLNLFPALLVAQFVIDIFCLMFTPVHHLVLTYVPIPINSRELYDKTGTQFNNNSNKSSQNGLGLGASATQTTPTNTAGENKDGSKKNYVISFVSERLKSVIAALLILVTLRLDFINIVVGFLVEKGISPLLKFLS